MSRRTIRCMRFDLHSSARRKVISSLVLAACVLLAGCASFTPPAPRLTREQCMTDAALVGTWSDTRLTQLGPAWEKISFAADCSYSLRAQLLFFRFRDRGQYRIENGNIQFERQAGRRVVPYRLDDNGMLLVTDAPGEILSYRRQ